MQENQRQCVFIKEDGERCKGWAITDSDYCFTHDPASAERRKAARIAGGKASRAEPIVQHVVDPRLVEIVMNDKLPIDLDTIEDIHTFAAQEIARLRERCLDRPPSLSESTVIRQWTELLLKIVAAEELGLLHERIEQIERLAGSKPRSLPALEED